MLTQVQRQLGRRVSLDNLAQATLNAGKSADGLAALRWWKAGKLERIAAYCRMDVDITRRLYLYGCEHGQVFCSDARGGRRAVPALWGAGRAR
jgi:DEAD/DEAH box helicase domain-containing protein